MKRMATFALAALILTAGSAFAQVKIGVVDIQRALNETKAGQNILADLQSEVDKQEAELAKMEQELTRLRNEIQSQGGILTPEARDRKMLQLEEKRKQAERYAQDARDRIRRQEDTMKSRLVVQIADTTRALGEELGYTLVVEAQGGGVVYRDESVDLTSLVIERFNKEWQKQNGK